MNDFVASIKKSLQNENWHAALFLALAMPDICGKIENPESYISKPRYEKWFTENLTHLYRTTICGNEVVFMSAADCYALRCSMLHAGSSRTEIQKAEETVKHFKFTTLSIHRVKNGNVLALNVSQFCNGMCNAVELWEKKVSGNVNINTRTLSMLKIETSGGFKI